MKPKRYFVIDFDSTFTKVEGFDALADISLRDHPDLEKIKAEIVAITNQGMEGSISFRESLEKRIELLSPNKRHLEQLVVVLRELVSESFKRNREFFQTYADNIYIISNGFHAFIDPIVTEFGIKKENILANKFHFDA
ncbi:MAG: phosphoglycerate dehydrogenase, partial [Cyclobacteriaceae bacterium]|nr:phosphoglycerate dehydrogenase [Cyclobacteriaceae bacterium]